MASREVHLGGSCASDKMAELLKAHHSFHRKDPDAHSWQDKLGR